MSSNVKRSTNQFLDRLRWLGKEGASNAALSAAAFLAVIMSAMAAVTFWETGQSLAPAYFHGKALRSAIVVEAPTAAHTNTLFREKSFDLVPVQDGKKPSPRLVFSNIPNDLYTLKPTEDRKETFLKILLPSVLLANEELQHIRNRILRLEQRTTAGLSLSSGQREWLSGIARKYDVDEVVPLSDGVLYANLLEHIDIIPVELALAQGGIESGWGTSRVALEGNAIFGQRVWKRGEEVSAEPEVEILYKAYADILDATRSYAFNLNTHVAYDGFRKRRLEMRNAGNPLDAASLAGKLLRYSERGQAYVDQIRTVMAVNKLTDFSQAKLTPN